jgi:hypothetical protein
MSTFIVFLVLISSYLSFPAFDAYSCTIAVVSGSATPDNRPLLWKNRDKKYWINNEVKYFDELTKTAYEGFIGIIDADDSTEDTHVWSGVNDYGFAICNALVEKYGYSSSNNGPFMKAALINCHTVKEFEHFLDTYGEGNLSANFGVIDAVGEAAMFEVQALDDEEPDWVRTDAASVPCGYIVMANYNCWVTHTNGLERKERAEELLGLADNITHEYILRYVARDLDVDSVPGPPYETYNFISRWKTRSCTVVHGVDYPEDPFYTTFWTLLGEPAFSVAVPLFSYAHDIPEEFVALPGQAAPMNEVVKYNELRCYYDNTYDQTIEPEPLWETVGVHPPIQEYAFDIEDHVFKLTAQMIDWWKSIKRFKVPSDFRIYENYTSWNVHHFYESEDFKPWTLDYDLK